MINYIINLSFHYWVFLMQFLGGLQEIPTTDFKVKERYEFIRYDQNEFFYPEGQEPLVNFFETLSELVDSNLHEVNIVHIGDSHIQADFFTARVRKLLQEDDLLGNSGRGFFFPCGLAKTNTAHNLILNFSGAWQGCHIMKYNKSCQLGLSGYKATTYSPSAYFSIKANEFSSSNYASDILRVYYNTADSSNFRVALRIKKNSLIKPQKITEHYVEFQLKEPLKLWSFQLYKNSVKQRQFTLNGVYAASTQRGVLYHATGVNGTNVNAYHNAPRLVKELPTLNPDLFIISLGTNDAYVPRFDSTKFHKDYARLIDSVRKVIPEIPILLTSPPDSYMNGKPNTYNVKVVEILYKIAQEKKCAVWDMHAVMGGLGSMNAWYKAGLTARDRLHFSNQGYYIQGDLFYEALMKAFLRYYILRN